MNNRNESAGDTPSSAGGPAAKGQAWRRLVPLVLLGMAAGIVIGFDLHAYLTLDALREHRRALADIVAERAVLAAATYMLVYAASTALSLPGGAALSITGGFLFGGFVGGIFVVIGATVGATLVFLAARTVLGESLRTRAGPWFERMEAGFQANALSYLLTLRLIPLFPFFVVNLAPAFLGVSLRTYVVATAFGIVPGSLVFTFTGAGIGSVLDSGSAFSVSGVFTPEIIGALTGLGLLSLLPAIHRHWRSRKPVPPRDPCV